MQPAAPLPTQPVSPPPFAPALPGREVTFGSLVGRTFSVWKQNLLRFAAVMVLIRLPALALGWAVGSPLLMSSSNPFARPAPQVAAFVFGPGWWALTIAGALLGLVQMGALTAGAVQSLAGKPASPGEMLAAGLRRALPILLAGVPALLAIYGGLLLLLVPGVLLALMLCVTVPVVMTERLGPLKSLGRSRALTKGHRWKLLGALIVAYAAVAAPGGLVAALAYSGSYPMAAWALATAVNAIFGSLVYVVPAVAYHDLRVAGEGVATAELARVFE